MTNEGHGNYKGVALCLPRESCPSFVAQRRDLLAKAAELLHPFLNFTDLSNEALVQLKRHHSQRLRQTQMEDVLKSGRQCLGQARQLRKEGSATLIV